MNKAFVLLLLILCMNNLSANYSKDNQDPPKDRKAHLIVAITKTLSESQADYLKSELKSLSLNELEEINEDPRHLESFLVYLESKEPDDDNEHTVQSK